MNNAARKSSVFRGSCAFLLFKSFTKTAEAMNKLDKYDHMILDIIQQHKIENQCHIRLALERNFGSELKRIPTSTSGRRASESASRTSTWTASSKTRMDTP